MRQYRQKEQGVASIIIVMFSVLLLVTVTVGFMQLMMSEQVRSDDNELSQGAYDSAVAGVEDGKRVLAACLAGDTNACTAVNNQQCSTVSDAGLVNQVNGEVMIKSGTTGASGSAYNQSYTCVIISRETDNYEAPLSEGQSRIIPLNTVSQFSNLVISWRVPSSSTADANNAYVNLRKLNDWGAGLSAAPLAMMRVQFIQHDNGSIDPAYFDGDGSRTLYLYPTKIGGAPTTINADLDSRRTGTLQPVSVSCSTPLAINNGYNCQAVITNLPGGANRLSYLRVTSLYAGSEFRVEPRDSSNATVRLVDVQPSIDSTGKAADILRRVSARVEPRDTNDSNLYPRATVDISKNFCKVFTVSSDAAVFDANTAICNPNLP